MAVADTKELAQCLAFAYFAENPDYKQKGHDVAFFNLFSGKENVSVYKHKYLSNQFPIDAVKKEFVVSKTPTGKIAFNPTTKKVYLVAKTCIEKKLFKFPLTDYEFLDQNDSFVLFIKDKCLTNIKTAFELTYKIDSLSAIDVFFVKKSSKAAILKEFNTLFTNKDTILVNAVWGTKLDYTSITEKYMDSGELVPVSLKLPPTISGNIQVKRVQLHASGDSSIEVDPYIKFLAAILNDPSKTKEYIEKVIEIHYDKFSTGELLNWVFPVTFNYKALTDPTTKQPLAEYNLNFNLFAQGYGAGWNGQFDMSTREHQATQWVGGVSSTTFTKFAEEYPEYHRVANEMVNLRVKCFEDFCNEIDKDANLTDAYFSQKQSARSELSQHKILITSTLKKTTDFFDLLQKDIPTKSDMSLLTQYEVKFTDAVRNKKVAFRGDKSKKAKILYGHFVHAQLSYFLLSGGSKMESYFKRRLFMTVFGLITKKSHVVIDDSDYPEMRNLVHKEIFKNKEKVKAEFSTAPHFLIS